MVRTTLLATATLIAAAAPAAAGPYSQLVIFGDSLTDVGNARIGADVLGLPDPAPPPFFMGRFSNGPIWADYVHDALIGGPSLPAAPLIFGLPDPSGQNYAIGGARAATNADPSVDFLGQLAFYNAISGGVADPDALYVVAFGSNDITANIQGTGDEPSIADSVSAIITGMAALNAAGARNFLVLGVADIGNEPRFVTDPVDEAFGRAFSIAFDKATRNALDATPFLPGTRVTYHNGLRFFDALEADPTAFGLPPLDGVTPCFTVAAAIPDCTGYAFADFIHPTSAVHFAYARDILATVPTPASVALFGLGVLALAGGRHRRT
jgi:phospholipase/lecithinase/hemolysin